MSQFESGRVLCVKIVLKLFYVSSILVFLQSCFIQGWVGGSSVKRTTTDQGSTKNEPVILTPNLTGSTNIKYSSNFYSLDLNSSSQSLLDFSNWLHFGSIVNNSGSVNYNHYYSVTSYDTSSVVSGTTQMSVIEYDSLTSVLWVADSNHNWPTGSPTRILAINTKGTPSFQDDVLIDVYSSAKFPGLADVENIRALKYDATTGLLYIAGAGLWVSNGYWTHGGIGVVDTQKTLDTTDDVYVGTINSTLFPAVGNWNVNNFEIAPDIDTIYVGTFYANPSNRNDTGVYAIRRNGTTSLADDTFEQKYNEFSTPLLNGISFNGIKYSPATGFLFVCSTSAGGFGVIDTKKTATAADDTIAYRYTSVTSPTVTAHGCYELDYSDYSGLLSLHSYAGGSVDSLLVVNTNFSANIASHTIVKNFDAYDSLSEFSPGWGTVFLSPVENKVFTLTDYGLQVIKLGSLTTTADDRPIVKFPEVKSWWMNSLVYAANSHTTYFTSYGGIHAIPDSGLSSVSYSITSPRELASISPAKVIPTTSQASTDSNKIFFQTSVTSAAYWRDDFDDGNFSNVSDIFSWGAPASMTETGGILTLYGGTNNWPTVWFDSGLASGTYYPKGTIFKIKYRAVTNMPLFWAYVFDGDKWTVDAVSSKKNEWTVLEVVAIRDTRYFGFEFWTQLASGWNAATDRLEIDWVEIHGGPSMWNSWISAPKNPDKLYDVKNFDTNSKWVRYKVESNSSDLEASNPSLSALEVGNGYVSSGTLVFQSLDASSTLYKNLAVSATVPASSSYVIEVSSDSNTWTTLGGSQTTSSLSLEALKGILNFRIKMTNENPTASPLIEFVQVSK